MDALHLGAAVRLHAEAVLTYDHRMIEAADELGVRVFGPVLRAAK